MDKLGKNYREYRTVDKSKWKRGEWDTEPDKAQWIDAETGLDCLIVRNHYGALCGYVGVPDGHVLHGKDYNTPDVRVHGGLTFADRCHEATAEGLEKLRQRLKSIIERDEARKYPQGDSARFLNEMAPVADDLDTYRAYCESHYICHVPALGRTDVWWFGFDCAHSGDVCPSHDRYGFTSYEESYKDWGYVVAEVRRLARQIYSGISEPWDAK